MYRPPLILIAIVLIIISLSQIIDHTGIVRDDNITILKDMARDYYNGHEYTLEGDYVCYDMALDFWDMATAHKMDARIVVGNRTKMPDNIRQANHAWVIVEVEPGRWVPVEVVNGTVMDGVEPYYHGWIFETPNASKMFINQYDDLTALYVFYGNARNEYNQKTQIYNQRINSGADREQVEEMVSEIEDLRAVLDYTESKLNITQSKLREYEEGIPKILGAATL